MTMTNGYGGYGAASDTRLGGARASVLGGGGGGGAGSTAVGGSTSTSAAGLGGAGTITDFYGVTGTFGVGGNGGVGAAGAIAGSSGYDRGNGGAGGAGGLNGSSAGDGGRGSDGLVVIRYAVPPVSMPDLAGTSDSGQSSTDNLTRFTQLTFTGTAPVGATVQLYVDGVASGSTCTADGTTGAFSCITDTLAEGARSVTAKSSVVLSGGLVESTSNALTVNVDTTAPTATLTAATLQWGSNGTGQSTDAGSWYLVKNTVSVSDVASITSAAGNLWNSGTVNTANTPFTASTSGLTSGEYVLYSTDAAGNLSAASSSSVTFVDDTTAPVVTLTSARLRSAASATVRSTETGTIYLVRSTVTVNALSDITSAQASQRTSASVTTANTDVSVAVSGLGEGTYYAYGVDPAGNLSTLSTDSVIIDTTAPTVSTFSSSATSYTARTFDLTLVFSESVSGLSSSDFSYTGTATSCTFTPDASSGSSFTVTVACTGDGSIVAKLSANSVADAAGNTGPASIVSAASVALGATPTQLVLTTSSVGTASGAAFTTQPAVTMKNAQGQVIVGVSGTVTASITQVNGTGALVGTATANFDTTTGVATFANLGISGRAGTQYTITYASGSLSSATQIITPTVGAAVGLAVSTQPVGSASGAAFSTQPVVRIVDSGDNTVSSATASVSVSSTSGTIGGTRPKVTVSGIATFTDLTFSGLATQSHTLSFTASGLAPVTSSSFTVTAGAATQLYLVTQSVGTESGSAFTTQPSLEIRDSGGNKVATSSATVTA
ncbi:MAG: hypothetical protein EBT97_12475, partial [Actinobacteria bacterium]|nr:hypothetical protein [Actinomycetota bacterium]